MSSNLCGQDWSNESVLTAWAFGSIIMLLFVIFVVLRTPKGAKCFNSQQVEKGFSPRHFDVNLTVKEFKIETSENASESRNWFYEKYDDIPHLTCMSYSMKKNWTRMSLRKKRRRKIRRRKTRNSFTSRTLQVENHLTLKRLWRLNG